MRVAKMSGVEDRGNISHFLTPPPVKLGEGGRECWAGWSIDNTAEPVVYIWRAATARSIED